jgi:predicted nucleotide-binding protein (sugar kinase/HSP70/actin superfamily)
VSDAIPASSWRDSAKRRIALMNSRSKLRIGVPRVLNMYVYAPLFSAYLESLGILSKNIVYSDFTTNEMYRGGSSRGSIDPCFPSKIVIAHVHNLIFNKRERGPLDHIFLPMFDVLCSPLVRTRACNACPTAAVTPETVKAAYTKEINIFAENNIGYLASYRQSLRRQAL